jgi:Transposase and inactivated derivatives
MEKYDQNLKEWVMADYLSGGGTYRQLQANYGISFQLIHQWVQVFKGANTPVAKAKTRTIIVIGDGLGYLSLMTDAFSRKIVGFCLHKTLSAQGTIAALKQALKNNPNTKGLIHHHDRGVQYCCHEYVEILQNHHINISMTENADPLENAIAERVNGILKTERLNERFHSFAEAQEAIAIAISTYNHLRPHNSIGNLTPFEAHSLYRSMLPKRLWKNYDQPKPKEVTMEVV